MRHDYPTIVGSRVFVVGLALMANFSGCEKVPTFQELTKQEQPTPAAPATPVDPMKPAPAQQPPAVASVAPAVEEPQKVIANFQKKASFERTDQDLARLGNLPSELETFTEINLNGSNSVSDAGLKHLSKLQNLESLGLQGTKITEAGLAATLELPKLTKLDLAGCVVTLPMMETLSRLEHLEVLSLDGTRVGDNELQPLANMPGLKELNLNKCPITDNAFKVLGTLKSLEVLRVANTTINGSGMQFMKRKKTEAGLRILEARVTHFGEQGLQHIKGVETLEELDLGQAEVTDRTLAAHLKGVTHLKKLNLSFNSISNNGTQVLGGIKALEELTLINCFGVGDQTLYFLRANKELKILDVNGCGGVTNKGVEALKKLLPNCEIRFAGGKL